MSVLARTVLMVLLLVPWAAADDAPQFLREVDWKPLNALGVQHSGRVVPFAIYADAFVHDLHGRSGMTDGAGWRVPAPLVLLEAIFDPERAIEWCRVPAGDLPGLGVQERLSTLPAWEALEYLAFGNRSAELDTKATQELAVLEARLALLVFAIEEVRLLPDEQGGIEWLTLAQFSDPDLNELIDRFAIAWRVGDAPTVNNAMADLVRALSIRQSDAGVQGGILRLELLLTSLHLLSIAVVLYALACGLALLWSSCRRLIIGLLCIALAVHLLAVIARAVVMDRLPIQNHYESMIAAAAMVGGAALLYGRRKDGPTIHAVGAGIAACLIAAAEWLELPGRVLELEAGILSSTAILKYHVLTILAGYALIMLGAGIGVAVLVRRARGASLDQLSDLHRLQVNLGYSVFWVLGIGILLGAIWADRAWGRWWAFDPKETWALVTWLVYLGMVHIPASKLAAHRRPVVVAILHIIGLLAMLWTYFGVNLILPSLHSYA